MSVADKVYYKVHGNTVFIEGNGLVSQYIVHGDKVSKVVQHFTGDEFIEPFHTIGDTPLNTEAILLNELRDKGEL